MKIIETFAELNNFVKKLDNTKNLIAIDTETSSLNPIEAQLVGIGFCLGNKFDDLYYVPTGHQTTNNSIKQLNLEVVLNALKNWLENPKKMKTLQNCKFDRQIFYNHGIDLKGVVFDTLLADYVLNNQEKHGLNEISLREFGYKPKSFKETIGKLKNFSFVDIKEASIYCGYDVFLTRKISELLLNKVETNNKLSKVLFDIELPLEPVLSQMENSGIRIDIPYLNQLSDELKESLLEIEKKVFDLAGKNFNLASPKQLGEILFEELDLDKKKSRKTKTGWSTDAAVLDKLSDEHKIIPLLIEHRTSANY